MSTEQNLKWTFAKEFTQQFEQTCSELDVRFESAKSQSGTTQGTEQVINDLSIEVQKLSKSLTDAAGSLPAHGQRAFETQISRFEKALQDLKSKSAPKAKFAFKRKPAAVSANTQPPSSTTAAASSSSAAPTQSGTVPSAFAPWVITGYSNKYLSLATLPHEALPPNGQTESQDLLISDLDTCIINLLPSHGKEVGISAIHARNIRNTVILLPLVKGSALLHDLTNTVLVLGCHQFRMHTSNAVDVYVAIASNPIIEHCKQIRFAAYPETMIDGNTDDAGGIAATKTIGDGYQRVQDFSHIKATPSPNWEVMSEVDIKTEWPLDIVLANDEDVAVAVRQYIPVESRETL